MSRQKRTCDYERPSKCRKLAVTRIVARRARDGYRHESQYCEEHDEVVVTQVPQGWEIVATEAVAP